jgi:hypothetical protein
MDPFVVLGVSPGSSPREIRNAWRQLAKKCHPDAGGNAAEMVCLNEALAQALDTCVAIAASDETPSHTGPSFSHRHTAGEKIHRVRHDVSSFTFNVLPVESFELLEIVANISGSVIESDCPYLVEFSLENLGDQFSASDWCRCELVPEAGGTMVHLTVGGFRSSPALDVEEVRDELIRCVNEIDDISLVEQKPS